MLFNILFPNSESSYRVLQVVKIKSDRMSDVGEPGFDDDGDGDGRPGRAGSIGLRVQSIRSSRLDRIGPRGDGDSFPSSGLDRIEGDSQFARAGSIGLALEDVNIDVNGGSARARSIELRFR